MSVMLLLKMYESNISNYVLNSGGGGDGGGLFLQATTIACLNDPQVHGAALLTLCSGKALMLCCPTFTDGLNLCPQLRQINPASAGIIFCSTL